MDITKIKFNKRNYGPDYVSLDFGKYALSVITGQGAYGGSSGLYEIAIFENASGDFVQLPGIGFTNDDVIGHLSSSSVNGIIKKMFIITGKEPVVELAN
tara:strand:+ start:885 stop:1181 length:297 start_codon:yes stop_codon:yes gene_type:complete